MQLATHATARTDGLHSLRGKGRKLPDGSFSGDREEAAEAATLAKTRQTRQALRTPPWDRRGSQSPSKDASASFPTRSPLHAENAWLSPASASSAITSPAQSTQSAASTDALVLQSASASIAPSRFSGGFYGDARDGRRAMALPATPSSAPHQSGTAPLVPRQRVNSTRRGGAIQQYEDFDDMGGRGGSWGVRWWANRARENSATPAEAAASVAQAPSWDRNASPGSAVWEGHTSTALVMAPDI
jgi:hypothetical protein